MTASINHRERDVRAICPHGAFVPVRQAVVTMSTPLETYSTANRPAVIICRIQYRSAAPHGGMLARIVRRSSRAVLASPPYRRYSCRIYSRGTLAGLHIMLRSARWLALLIAPELRGEG